MTTLFSFPGSLDDAPQLAESWSSVVDGIVATQVARSPQFFDPTDEAGDAVLDHAMQWGAFPRKLARLVGQQRWTEGENRDKQEEYCEWVGTSDDAGRLVRASFTTETREYYQFLFEHAPDALARIYSAAAGRDVSRDELTASDGSYDLRNPINLANAVHMVQGANTLSAAVVLAAQASVVRSRDDGTIIEDTSQLIACGISADEDRNSDPLIVTDVNGLARRGGRISIKDPLGLYIQGLQTDGWKTPDDAAASSFWRVTRGASGLGVRAVFETPTDCDYEIGHITIHGAPITSSSQIAEHISVRLTGLARGLDDDEPIVVPCGQSPSGLESLEDNQDLPTRTSV